MMAISMVLGPWRLYLVVAALLMATTSAQTTNNNNDNNGGNFVLNLVHVNDHHSQIAEDTFVIPPEILPNVEDKARRVYYGGYARLVRLFRQSKNGYENVLKLHAGDALTGSVLYRLFGNQPDTDMMHHVCFDAFNLGNHEFDDGDAQLADFIRKLTDQEYV